MDIPLIKDLREDRPGVSRRLRRAAAFVAILLIADLGLATILKGGLDHYFGLDQPADILLVGHSHTVLAVDKPKLEQLTGMRVAKYAREGANLRDRATMIRQFMDRHPGEVRVVVLDVDAHTFTSAGLSANSYQMFLPFMGEPAVDSYLAEQNIQLLDHVVRVVLRSSRFNETTLNLAIRGLRSDWRSYKDGQVDVDRLSRQIASGDFRRITFEPEALEQFEAIRAYLREQGVGLVLAYYPTIDLLNAAEPNRFDESMRRLEAAAQPAEGSWLLDYNSDYESRHELFFDPVHMNPRGQAEITRRLAQDLTAIIGLQPARTEPPASVGGGGA